MLCLDELSIRISSNPVPAAHIVYAPLAELQVNVVAYEMGKRLAITQQNYHAAIVPALSVFRD